MSVSYKELTINGLWKNNPGLVQLLGLCPLLGTSNSVVNALGLGLATMLVLAFSNAGVSLIRNAVTPAVRLPIFVMIIAALTTCIELLMQAFTYQLYQILGIFIPLITTNCIILGRAEAFAAKNKVLASTYDGFIMGTGFACVLLAIGATRELLGTGVLFHNMHLLFGAIAENWRWVVFPDYKEFLLAILPPGAFLVLGLLIAAKNAIDAFIAKRQTQPTVSTAASRRVRVTGVVD
ncbi:electron transport complex subunit E [Pseudomonas sp. F1_0610]|uniref:electron transport complex subunit E n=1 Tax=Pseudomonas sp. F1_0610 TaxID=3114284 RepID=UPI0039C0ED3E